MKLHEQLSDRLMAVYKKLDVAGKMPSRQQLDQYYANFRSQFGPEVLNNLDGEALLEKIHGSGNHDSLIYWLEFKNDEEFPYIFGSIAGGTSLKFGIYRRNDTGMWMKGAPSNQMEISTDEAIQIARKHRDQLVLGCKLLEDLPDEASENDYQVLQGKFDRDIPDVSQKNWGHKYFSLMYPEKLDNYHADHFHGFYLLKLLQMPPEGDGRYIAAGRYVAIAKELGIHLNQLTIVLNHLFGKPYRYWKVLTNIPNVEGFSNNWEVMKNGGFVAIGWAELGDIKAKGSGKDLKDYISSEMKKNYNEQGGWASEIYSFVENIQEGDIVLAFERSTIFGIGRINGPYQYDPSTPRIPHHRQVEWLSDQRWEMPSTEAKGRVVMILKSQQNILEIEKRISNIEEISIAPATKPTYTTQLPGIPGRIQANLERKKQVILYGPPGTGKTYWARHAAQELSSYGSFGLPFSELSDNQKKEIIEGDDNRDAKVRVCTFHPAYGYEDFLEGYRPVTMENQLVFIARDGIFKRLCHEASLNPKQRFYLIIDEINRGDIPRIFGELLTILEADKRNMPVILPISGERFTVPPNVYLIGTMNTADRSIALLDTALRRRFGFIELMPDSSVLGSTMVGGIPLAPWLDALNERIMENIGRDARNLQIGHAYFLENGSSVTDIGRFTKIIQDDILPLLEEYCYEDYHILAKILGKGLVDELHQCIHQELFDPANRDDLILSLLAPSPEIVASPRVVETEVDEMGNHDFEDNEAGDDQEIRQ